MSGLPPTKRMSETVNNTPVAELDFSQIPWPQEPVIMPRIPELVTTTLDALHRVSMKPNLLGPTLDLSAIRTQGVRDPDYNVRVKIGDLLEAKINLRSAGAISLWAHGVSLDDSVQLLMYRYPGIYISKPKFSTVLAKARADIERHHPHSTPLLAIIDTSRARLLASHPERQQKEKRNTESTVIPANCVSPTTLALGGLYAIKGSRPTTVKELVGWGEYASRKSAAVSLNLAIRTIKSKPEAPEMLRSVVELTGVREKAAARQAFESRQEEIVRQYIAGMQTRDIAIAYGLTRDAIQWTFKQFVDRYSELDSKDRPDCYQDLVDELYRRRSSKN